MSFAALLFAGMIYAGAMFTASCVEGWTFLANLTGERSTGYYSLYKANVCGSPSYMAINAYNNCCEVEKRDGHYYVMYKGEWEEIR